MVIYWTDKAQKDVGEFVFNEYSNNSESTRSSYMKSLIAYTLSLADFPKLGKVIFCIQKIEIRQIIYKKHRILYYIDDSIHIISVLHTSRDINKFFKYLRENM